MSKVLCEKSDLIAIADSVRSKTGTTGRMKITEIPQKIEAIETGGNINLQEKALTITSNGITTVTPDTSYDALSKVDVTVNVVGDGGSPTGPYIEYTSLDSSGRVFTAKFRGTIVPEHAFSYLAELTSVDMPDNVIAIGDNGFYRCPKLQLTSLPSGLTSLPTAAFQYCPKLALTTFPSGMTSIGAYAFRQGTGLASITLPPALTTIGDFAFANCTGLETVKFTRTVSSIPNGVFSGCPKLSTIYVPWSQGQVANAPWGASNATIIYDYTD